jgi:hypothetical protein
MVLARVAEYLFPGDNISHNVPTDTAAQELVNKATIVRQELAMEEDDLDAVRPAYIHVSPDDKRAMATRVD